MAAALEAISFLFCSTSALSAFWFTFVVSLSISAAWSIASCAISCWIWEICEPCVAIAFLFVVTWFCKSFTAFSRVVFSFSIWPFATVSLSCKPFTASSRFWVSVWIAAALEAISFLFASTSALSAFLFTLAVRSPISLARSIASCAISCWIWEICAPCVAIPVSRASTVVWRSPILISCLSTRPATVSKSAAWALTTPPAIDAAAKIAEINVLFFIIPIPPNVNAFLKSRNAESMGKRFNMF